MAYIPPRIAIPDRYDPKRHGGSNNFKELPMSWTQRKESIEEFWKMTEQGFFSECTPSELKGLYDRVQKGDHFKYHNGDILALLEPLTVKELLAQEEEDIDYLGRLSPKGFKRDEEDYVTWGGKDIQEKVYDGVGINIDPKEADQLAHDYLDYCEPVVIGKYTKEKPQKVEQPSPKRDRSKILENWGRKSKYGRKNEN